MRMRGEAAALLAVLLFSGTAAAQNSPAQPGPAPGGPVPGSPVLAGDPEAGRVLFQKCQTCHSGEIGVNKVGPSLWNVVGRKSATVPDYPYSPALRNAHKVWDAATLDAYLADPRHVLNGTRMLFQGLQDPRDRANVIAYLATLN